MNDILNLLLGQQPQSSPAPKPDEGETIMLNDLYRIVNNEAVEDNFREGTVIAWLQSGYMYAAIKTPVGWSTTAGENNRAQPQVPRVTDFLGLSSLLTLDKVTRVMVYLTGVPVKETS